MKSRLAWALLLLGAVGAVAVSPALAEQASEPTSPAAGQLDVGKNHTCAILASGGVRCWGYGRDGELGYPSLSAVGATQTPASVAPVDLGHGRTARAISAGDYHTCAILDDGSVRCWGYGADGRLGYGNTNNVGDKHAPGSVGPVDLGPGRTARAISAGLAHTCAVLDDGSVRCWGFNFNGQLGYGDTKSLGDAQTPASAGPVDLGAGRTAKAISAGGAHTCAILDDDSVRCWGYSGQGELGYGNTNSVGDTQAPGSVGPVDLGPGRTARAISAGLGDTCAILDDGSVRCWGFGAEGRLGYGNTSNVGDVRTPASVRPVDLGAGRTAIAISAGETHTCAILDDGSVRCWGSGADGRLGYGDTSNVGDAQTPAAVGPVDLGPGRTAVAISAGGAHTCVRLDQGAVRCWGYGAYGQLGYCNTSNVGDTHTPASAGPVNLQPGDGGVACAATPSPGGGATLAAALARQAARGHGFAVCLAIARLKRLGRARRGHARQACLTRYGRTPGLVTDLRAHAVSKHRVVLTFTAPGTDGERQPAARGYLVKQSLRPINDARGFARAHALCHGSCRFPVVAVGAEITLAVTQLQPHTTYYYAIAARDNVTGRPGRETREVTVRTR